MHLILKPANNSSAVPGITTVTAFFIVAGAFSFFRTVRGGSPFPRSLTSHICVWTIQGRKEDLFFPCLLVLATGTIKLFT